MAYHLEYEDLMARVDALLQEWGEHQRRSPGVPHMGYPSQSTTGRAMDWHDRSGKGESGKAPTRPPRYVEIGGKRQRRVDMIPRQAERQTRVRNVAASAPWPEHVEAVEKIAGRLPRDLICAITVYYRDQLSLRECADVLRIPMTRYRQHLDRAQHMIAAQVLLDERLSA